MKRTLQLIFKDSEDKNKTLSLDNPREDLEKEEIQEVMDLIILENIFSSKGNDLEKISNAKLITKKEEILL